MKFCTHCGKELSDDSKFCTGCGNPVREKDIPGQSDHTHTSVVLENNPAKNAVCSNLYLAAVIGNSVYLGITLLSVLASGTNGVFSNYMNQLESLMGYSGYSWTYYRYINMLSGLMKGVSVLSMLPPILFCIGLWMIYTSALKRSEENSTGFTLAKVAVKIQLVGYAIIFALLLLVLIFIGFAAEELGAMIFAAVLVGGIGALMMLFYIKELNSLDILRADLKNGGMRTLSSYVYIIGFISGVLAVFSLFSADGFMGVISVLGRIVWIFAASVWMMQYGKNR